jgi:hypothetical protein
VVYIRHHTQAKEVDEHEFFYSQETGGTIVSSALKLMDEVVKERYDPAQWNIYAAQASDGDNWADDSPLCHEILAKKILPVVRYYSYIEITRRAHRRCGANMNICRRCLIISPSSISAIRKISTRCSASFSTSRTPAPTKHRESQCSARWLFLLAANAQITVQKCSYLPPCIVANMAYYFPDKLDSYFVPCERRFSTVHIKAFVKC